MSMNGGMPPPQVPLAPVPTTVSVAQGQGADGAVWVLIVCDTPLGRAVFHLTPEGAKATGEALQKLGAAGPLILGGTLPGAN